MISCVKTLMLSGVSHVVRLSIIGACVLVGALAIGAVPVLGLVTHQYLSRITEVPAVGPHGEAVGLPGPLPQVRSMAVGSGDRLFVAGNSGGREQIDEFNGTSGAFLGQLFYNDTSPAQNNGIKGLAVDRSNGYLLAGRLGEVAVFSESGVLLKTWSGAGVPGGFGNISLNGIAVDNDPTTLGGDWAAGDVFVATSSTHVVTVLKPKPGGEEEYVTQITGVSPSEPFNKSISGPNAVAVNEANGDVLIADGNLVDILRPSALDKYELVRQITGTQEGPFTHVIETVTIDPGTGEIYVIEETGKVVYEFGETGAYRGRVAQTPTAPPLVHDFSAAADPASHHFYVSSEYTVDLFGPGVTVPDVLTEPATGVTPSKATLQGSVNPLGEGKASCKFLWGESEELVETVDCPVEYEGNAAQKTEVELSNLQPDTTYYYRLEASNKNGTNPSEEMTASCEGRESTDACFTTPGPGIREQWATNVSATAATLQATVDPHGKPASAYLQYGPCAAGLSTCASSPYASNVPASPGEMLGAGFIPVAIAPEHIAGLSSGAIYHYQVVVLSETNAGETVAFYGPEETFTTQARGVAGLPDGRAWELVSPAQKRGALVEPIGQEGLIQSSLEGAAFTFHTNQPTEADPAGYANQVQLLSVRGPSGGWSAEDIEIPHAPATGKSEGVGEDYRFFSENLAYGIVQPAGAFIPASSSHAIAPAESSEQTAFLREDFNGSDGLCASGCYRPLVTGMPGYANVWEPERTHFGEEGVCPYVHAICGPHFEAASPNGRHVVVGSSAQLTEIPTLGRAELYEWSAGRLTLVSVLPNGEPASGGPSVQPSFESARHAVSEDGSRVFWQAGVHLYMTDTETGKSVQLDAVQSGSGQGVASPYFQAASSEGSRVFFNDSQQLTEGSGATQTLDDLYECQIAVEAGAPVCKLSDLTPAVAGQSANATFGVPGVSEDGEWVYFVADGVLENESVPVSGAVHGTCQTSSTSYTALCNLYVRHDGVTRLVAVISEADYPDWGSSRLGSLLNMTSRVSLNGQWFAFMSSRSLTGYDNRDAVSDRPDEELYLYHATANGGAGQLICASCDPTGGRPAGVEVGQESSNQPLLKGKNDWSSTTWLAATVPSWTNYQVSRALYQSRYLSNSGRLFFDSPGALVPQDVNGTWDVYEYEPPGVGSCSTFSSHFSERSDGCLGLISSGESAAESAFMDASETGGDVFFLTLAKLTVQDYDDAYDVYDAHECTSASPCLTEIPQPPPCATADACRAAPTPQPEVFGAPSSATFTGNGNVPPSSPAGVVMPKSRPLARAQKLAAALRACRRERKRSRRASCVAGARSRYGARGAIGSAKRASARRKGGR